MKSPISTAVTIAIAIIIILGLLIPVEPLVTLKTIILDWVITIGAVAALIAIINLVRVHSRYLFKAETKNFYSLFFLIGFFFVLIIGMTFGTSHPLYKNLSHTIIISVESSLLGLLAFSLAIACFKLFKQKNNSLGVVFSVSTIVFLLTLSGVFSVFSTNELMSSFLDFINQIPIAGIRGILIGVSLGTIATGVRVLIGADRPYRG
ncbi:MAG: hypothetical protein CL609_07145 [Anaerolineaceae bacterium]|nr:hypothetical protein [Anaerolineaceae bacterium]